MNEHSSLVCPKCGGLLRVKKQCVTFDCINCGTKMTIRSGFYRNNVWIWPCPICHRIDKIEAFSKVIRRPDSRKSLSEAFSSIVLAKRIGKELSLSGQMDWINVNDKHKSNWTKLGTIGAVISFTTMGLFLILALTNVYEFELLILLLILYSVTFILTIAFVSKGSKADKNYKAYLSDLLSKQNTNIVDLITRLGYCQRDDVVFVPGEASFAPKTECRPFLLKLLYGEP